MPLRLLAAFAVLCSELSVIEISFLAEILGRLRIDAPKNSQDARCSFAVSAVFEKYNCPEGGITRKLLEVMHDAMGSGDDITKAPVRQLIKCCFRIKAR